jgi:hypothetical protein
VVQVHVLADRLRRRGLTVAKDRDGTRGRQVTHGEYFVAEQSVDEGALAAVVLADDDEEEELVHLAHERGESLEVRARAVGSRKRIAHPHHESALEGYELALVSSKDLFQAQARAGWWTDIAV